MIAEIAYSNDQSNSSVTVRLKSAANSGMGEFGSWPSIHNSRFWIRHHCRFPSWHRQNPTSALTTLAGSALKASEFAVV
jgi:hypothetical protein